MIYLMRMHNFKLKKRLTRKSLQKMKRNLRKMKKKQKRIMRKKKSFNIDCDRLKMSSKQINSIWKKNNKKCKNFSSKSNSSSKKCKELSKLFSKHKNWSKKPKRSLIN